MNAILKELSICIERGKISKDSNYPADMKGSDGAVELTKYALENNITAKEILDFGMLEGMKHVGDKFRDGKIFLPEVLISAKAMSSAMELLKPYFQSGEITYKGKIVLGTVAGDLHDIGKNIVKMVLEGDGWQIIDLGVNVSAEKFIEEIGNNSVKIVGLSALLTTTMQNMNEINKRIKEIYPDTIVVIGGAPVTQAFADSINVDAYFSVPQDFVKYLNQKCG